MEPDFKEGDQVLVSTLNFKNLEGPKKMRDSFVEPFTIINMIVKMQWRSNSQRNFQETPSIPSKFGEAILPDRGGKVPLQEEKSHFTRNSGSGRLP
ncbi:hypothetical protein O181_088537 [Austropuccinia psidii MF-1]|uniref:Uncharacterized protein n=1 Tax=Austropuccinia psidii MF-1 TaxID=1389203 RepID=A0A9Q3IRT8_9BASI|nr:hypothetical protein [Austropuccinia psidii MF-1]